MSGQLHVLATLPSGQNPGNNLTSGWVDHTFDLDVLENTRISCPCRDSNPGPSNPYATHYTVWVLGNWGISVKSPVSGPRFEPRTSEVLNTSVKYLDVFELCSLKYQYYVSTESLSNLTDCKNILCLLNAEACLWPEEKTTSVFQYQHLKFYYCKFDVQIDFPRYTTGINQFYLVGTVEV